MNERPIPLSREELARLASLGLQLEWLTEETGARLALRDLGEPKQLPLAVDFLASTVLHRLKHGLSKNQPLPRALGLRSLRVEDAPFVFDATAGLGTDAFMIAALGCRVRSVERDPAIHALLADGWTRFNEFLQPASPAAANADFELSDETRERLTGIASRLTFEHGDSTSLLRQLADGSGSERPRVVYLDPMYPEEGRSKSALPKKGMQVFRKLIGADEDAGRMMEFALRTAQERVVVKRPLHAPSLADLRPAHVFEGKTARYDMYLA